MGGKEGGHLTEQEYIRRAEALKEQLYRTAAIYLDSPAAVDAADKAIYQCSPKPAPHF
jgi:hypothetical protein